MSGDDGTDVTLSAHLGAKGAVELLCEINPDGSQFNRLVEGVSVSRSTVSTRLQEGEELGLYERQEIQGRGTSHAYQLTETGAGVRLYLDHSGLTERHRTIKMLRQQFDEGVNELVTWVAENEGDLKQPVQDDLREHLRRYTGP
ncbi:winged helix-turn-helix transcriptional regulator [Salinirubellus salinus]|uniref:Winged helix-turn-helix transcriptional regulator n=1 Tax=Salinirubellus salinus TaxID=1364945 RepID=A0A9E7R6Q6_9EURY|nr:winged helix-turn-helix transcriptional regulator [Salinirubellus salinus]UWM55690.1 winged helix-turn-helix transcriptional regulator [Salinirubellus salinus]